MSLIIHSSAEGFKSHELLAISVPLPTQIFANYLQLVYLILESSVLSKIKPCCLLLQIVLVIISLHLFPIDSLSDARGDLDDDFALADMFVGLPAIT